MMHVIGTFFSILAALWVWSWLQRRKQAKLVRRGMELLHPNPEKYPMKPVDNSEGYLAKYEEQAAEYRRQNRL